MSSNSNSNVDRYNKYMNKLRIMGAESVFGFSVCEEMEQVIITKYIENEDEYRVIEIPSFVTDVQKYIFRDVEQSLKIIHKDNQIDNMALMFGGFEGIITVI